MPMPLHIETPKKAKGPGILVLHSWWGFTPSIRTYCEELAARGFVVAAPDILHGRKPKTIAEARHARSSRRTEPIYKGLTRGISELLANAAVSKEKIGLVGFSMGGHWAVWLSQQQELPIASTVLYYAARSGDFSKCRSAFLAHYAAHDEWVSEGAKKRMEHAIRTAGCPLQTFTYEGTQHWFAERGQFEAYDPAASALAFERTAKHMKETLQAQRIS
jgi:carboxymethylenebutenolidase